MPLKPVDVPSFAASQVALLEAELQAEARETDALLSRQSPKALQRAGLALIGLTANSRRTGPGGRTVLELVPDPAVSAGSSDLPEHSLRVGDLVLVSEQPPGGGTAPRRQLAELERGGARGVVSRLSRTAVSVVLDEGGDEDEVVKLDARLWIVKLADQVTFCRLRQTMQKLEKMHQTEFSPLFQVLFGTNPLSLPDPAVIGSGSTIEWIDPSLNESQREAILFASASRELAVIHGPPGTGKTRTLVELILQMVRSGLRILVCGPSNISVDNLVERLAPHGVPLVRLGHPARLLPSVVSHSLDALSQNSDAAAIVRDVRADMDKRLAAVRQARGARQRRVIWTEFRELRREFRDREQKAVANVLAGCRIVLATLHGAGGSALRMERFDAVVVDEASQALEAQCWVPLLTGAGSPARLFLAGDPLQLPPTVKSSSGQLETTLLDRVIKMHGPAAVRMLTTQYRMHEAIMAFPSAEMYEARLQAAGAVARRRLCDLPYGVVADDEDRLTTEPLVFYDTQGGEFPEQAEDESSSAPSVRLVASKSNRMEAAVVQRHVERLMEAGLRPDDLAVITPYNAQVALLSPLRDRFPGIEIGSVDGFQGREQEAVVISLVRSNDKGEVGFLADKRRLNVAMTRPKRSLTVVGDSETIKRGGKFLERWMTFLEENAELRYPDPAEALRNTP